MSRVYFTDRDLGKRCPEILRQAGLTVERHADHFAPDAPDTAWLEAIGKRGWIALTHDQRIRYKPNERDAVMRNGVALLVIVGAAPFPDLARIRSDTAACGRLSFQAQAAVHRKNLSTVTCRDRPAKHSIRARRTLVSAVMRASRPVQGLSDRDEGTLVAASQRSSTSH